MTTHPFETFISPDDRLALSRADCLEWLAGVPTASVDLAVVDPPYFKVVAHQWDRQWKTEAEYLAWCRKWTAELVRVLKPNSCLYVWGTTKTDTFLRYKLEILNAFPELVYQNWIIWSYDWGGRTKKTFARKHEDLLMYSKGDTFPFNADAVRIPYKMAASVRAGVELNRLGKIPTDVWEKNNHTTSKEYVGWHPTQKPVDLLSRIVRANSPEVGLVLDCFSGSGSTAVAALREGRRFIGCEREADYVAKSVERISNLTGVSIGSASA